MESIKKFEPLFGEWYAESKIGSGGYGTVYKVYRDTPAGREYAAVKYISVPEEERKAALRSQGIDEKSLAALSDERLMDVNRELAIAERLRGYPDILGYDETLTLPKPDGVGYDVFIRMEYAESLAERMKRLPITCEEAGRLGSQIATAIETCSVEGVVHRNVKPENIFVTPNGDFKLGDMGNARIKGGDAFYTRGSDNEKYLAPEVLKGGAPDETSDVYSLGLVLYRAMNKGRMPFMPPAPMPVTAADSEKANFRRIAGAALPAPADADEKLSRIILKACAYEVKDRYITARELRRAFAAEEEPEEPTVNAYMPFEESVSEVRTSPEAAPEAELAAPVPVREEKRAKKEKPARAPREELTEPEYEDEEPGSGRGLKAALIVVSIITVLALLGVIGMLAKKVIDRINEIPSEPEIRSKAPEIVQDPADKDLYHVTVYEKSGTSLVYESIDGKRREYAVPAENRMTFDIRGETLLPNEPIDSTAYSVQPKIYVRGSDGTLTPVSGMGYIMVDVPQLTVRLDCGESIFTDEGEATVSGQMDQKDAMLMINGELMELSSDGKFSYSVSYDQDGVYEIPIEARMPKYAVYRQSVSVTVDLPEPPMIRLPWDLDEHGYSQRVTDPGESVEVHGVIPEGSVLEARLDPEPEISDDPEAAPVPRLSDITLEDDGHFSFFATLPEIGDYKIILTCTDPDGLVSEREMHVQRAPEYSSYVQKAWAMNYEALTRPSKQTYNLKGTVTQIIQHGDYYIAALETSGGTLLIEYHNHYPTANTLTVGREYHWIYGYPLGRNEEGAPVVYVWFIGDK